MESIGEEIDTKSSIHGSKKLNFYLPDPKQAGKSRKADKAFEDSLMQSNTLYLIDFDSATGTIYFANEGHISVLSSPYLFSNGEEVDKHLVHNSIGHDDNFISCLKIVHHSEETYIMAIIDDIVKFFKVKANGMIGELTYEFNLHGKGTITSVDIETFNNEVFILIVDSSHTLNLLNFGKKSICIKEDIYYACFALDTILCIDRDGERILILDSQKIDSQLAEHELEISEMKAVKLVNKQLIFIF